MTDTVKAWIEERRATHARATPGEWEEDAASGLEGCVYLADGSYECVADAMSTDDAGPIVDAHNMFPRALDALNAVLELHKPIVVHEDECPACGECVEITAYGGWEPAVYPCPTVRALEEVIDNE